MKKISVVINTFNAEKFLEKVLETVKFFDEIVICDMYSTDRTIEIAQKYNCHIVYHEMVGLVEPARSFAINQASNNWVLVVDADECVPEALRNYLYDQIKNEACPSGIRIPLRNYFMGRFLHSAYPDYILRFFNKNVTTWPPTIHSVPQIDGKIYTIPRNRKDLAFIHLANDSIETMIHKGNRYTNFEVQRRKNKNYGYLALIFSPFFRFFRSYILKGGFRDGKSGFIWAYFSAYYKFITISKVIESKIRDCDVDDVLK